MKSPTPSILWPSRQSSCEVCRATAAKATQTLTFQRRVCLWFRASICYPAARYHACHQGCVIRTLYQSSPFVLTLSRRIGRHCTGPVWYRQDRNLFHLGSSEARPQCQGMPGLDPCSHSRAGSANPKGCRCHRRLHVHRLPCMHWRY